MILVDVEFRPVHPSNDKSLTLRAPERKKSGNQFQSLESIPIGGWILHDKESNVTTLGGRRRIVHATSA